jgi:autotransporter-associated beta strand protein
MGNTPFLPECHPFIPSIWSHLSAGGANNPAASGGANCRLASGVNPTTWNLAGSSVAIKSLAMVPSANGNYTLGGIAAEKLTITDGIIVSSRSNQGPANFITVNSLTFGPNPVSGYEGIIHSYSGQALTINSSIGDNGTNAVSLTKAGPYALNLGGNNSLGGTLRINEGTVALTNSSSTTVRNVVIDGTLSGALDLGAGCNFYTTGSGTVFYVKRSSGGTALSGSGTLNLSGDVQVSYTAVANGSQTTLGANIGLGTASRTFTVDNGSSDPDLIVSGGISGSGGLIKAGAGQMRLSTNSGYSGQTQVSAGGLYLSGGSAAIAGSSSLALGAGTYLLLDNSGANNNDRVGDSAAVSLGGGSTIVKLTGNASAATTEAVGPLSFTGQNMISIDAAAGGVARLSAPSLTRVGKGVLVFCGDSPGAAAGPNVAQIRLATTPALVGSGTGVYTPVYPFGVGSGRVDDWGSRRTSPDGGGFLTYDAGTDSLRILSRTAEYTNSWTGADNANVYVGGGSINLTSNRTIQSFMLNDTSSGAHAINGNAGVQLTISSGLSFGHYYNMLTYNVPSLTFGNPTTGYEGIIYNFASDTASGQGTTINSVIRDNGANSVSLTIAGLGPTYVGGTNTYSGPTTVAGGRLILTTGDNRLPTGTTVDVHTGATLNLNGRSQAVAGIAGAGLITNSAAGVATLTVNAAADQAFGGSLAGNLNLVKNGAGSLSLTNATLNVGGTLTVNEGTVWLGAATFSNITVKSGAALRCLSSSRINATNATFESNATLYVALAGTNAADCTRLTVAAALTFANGAQLGVTPDPGVTPAGKLAWQIAQAQTLATLPRVLGGDYGVLAEGIGPVTLTLTYGLQPRGSVFSIR